MSRHSTTRDEGAVLVWVGLMMVALIGMGALVIDLGSLYVERRQLQNGADAGALAVAQDCAGLPSCATDIAPATMARTAADANATDGFAAVQVCGSGPGLTACATDPVVPPAGSMGWVRVTASTLTSAGQTEMPLRFAPVVGINSGRAAAKAVAAWGTPKSLATLPFIICQIQFEQAVGAIPSQIFPSQPLIVFSKAQGGGGDPGQPDGCPAFSGGGTISGNFSWLDVTDTQLCTATVTVGVPVAGGTGASNSLNNPCNLAPSDVLNKTFTVPLASSVSGNGNNARYMVSGFASFLVDGFDLGSGGWKQIAGCAGPPPGGNLRFFCGRFVEAALPDGEIGPGTDFGTLVVQMIG